MWWGDYDCLLSSVSGKLRRRGQGRGEWEEKRQGKGEGRREKRKGKGERKRKKEKRRKGEKEKRIKGKGKKVAFEDPVKSQVGKREVATVAVIRIGEPIRIVTCTLYLVLVPCT